MATTAALPVADLPLHAKTTTATSASTNGARINGTKSTNPAFAATEPPHQSPSTPDSSAYNALLSSLPRTHTAPLWEQMAALNPRLPAPKTVPHIWRYADVRPQLLTAGEVVPEEKAERRVLMFVNPGDGGEGRPPYTTDTLYAGLQLVNPGEVAPAHRHVAVATRFVIEAPAPSSSSSCPETAFTAIQGRRIPMARHDLIVTPRWTWHDHGNRGGSPVVWLDGLDLPSFQRVPVHFVEHWKENRYPAEEASRDECAWVVPWERMKGLLDSAARVGSREKSYVERRYTAPSSNTEISRVLGAMAARLAPGHRSPLKRETASAVWHVVHGSGWTEVDGARMRWTAGDTFAVPAWVEWRHGNDAEDNGEAAEAVYLYRFDDVPMLKALGWYRTDADDVEALADE
ncbi:RmlC-like cupin domain-containing protein [Phyllosticta capitalensis]|uniref:Gentisate 1,2-dioxygenase n=1 Tax=Phyllosticta capitalensis TaxID=121624 RepID=A0ABR1Y8H8_9PEZI